MEEAVVRRAREFLEEEVRVSRIGVPSLRDLGCFFLSPGTAARLQVVPSLRDWGGSQPWLASHSETEFLQTF